jgi:hypothetical protein
MSLDDSVNEYGNVGLDIVSPTPIIQHVLSITYRKGQNPAQQLSAACPQNRCPRSPVLPDQFSEFPEAADFFPISRIPIFIPQKDLNNSAPFFGSARQLWVSAEARARGTEAS